MVFVALCVYMNVLMRVFNCAYAVCPLFVSDDSFFCDKVAFLPMVCLFSDFFLVSFLLALFLFCHEVFLGFIFS